MKYAYFTFLLLLSVAPGTLAAGTISFKVPEVVVTQESGAAVIPIVFSGTPTGSGYSDGLIDFVDGTARGYDDYESIFYYSGVGIDFVEGQSEKNFLVTIYYTKSPVTKFFNLVLSGYNGSSVGTIPTVKVTILGWTPPQHIVNKIQALKKKIARAQRTRDPERRRKTVNRLKGQLQILVNSIS